jgi:hypothetical protein
MPHHQEAPASQDPLSPDAFEDDDSPPSADAETEVSFTETVTFTENIAHGPQAAGPTSPRPIPALTAVQLALQAGWTMAVLYGTIQPSRPGVRHLPTVHELPDDERKKVELVRLHHLLKRLAKLPECAGSSLSETAGAPGASDADLEKFNLAILTALAATEPEIELAYALGRSLRDTANPPGTGDTTPPSDSAEAESLSAAVSTMLARGRVARLQEWLATLSTHFPQHAAAIVATSVGRWSDLATATIDTSTPSRLAGVSSAAAAKVMAEYLLPQGDLWLMLLTGTRSTAGLLSPEGYVAAGEAALRRSARIVRGILNHYWVAWLLLAIATGGLLYLSIRYLGGAAKVWTSISTVAASLGISARSITSKAARLTAEAERPVFAMAEEDVMAWAITALPHVSLTRRGVRQLRNAGIAPSSALGRI